MTKNNDVIYVCDHCQKESKTLKGFLEITTLKGKGCLKVRNKIPNRKCIKLLNWKSIHFCSKKCLSDFFFKEEGDKIGYAVEDKPKRPRRERSEVLPMAQKVPPLAQKAPHPMQNVSGASYPPNTYPYWDWRSAMRSSVRCTLSDSELIDKIREANKELCETGGKSWKQSIPARYDKDPDLLIEELCSRFERFIQANKGD